MGLLTGIMLSERLHRLLPDPGPARVLSLAVLVATVGKGLTLTISVTFYTRSVGLSVREVAIGLGAAAAVGLVASTPMGHLADRCGPRGVMIALAILQAIGTGALVLVHSFWTLVAVLCLTTIVGQGSSAALGALLANVVPAPVFVRTRAYLRAVTNVGIAVGALIAGFALQVDTRAWYVGMILGHAVTCAAIAIIFVRLPHVPPVAAAAHGPRLVALRDRPYLVYAALNGLLCIHYGVLNIALPLWVVQRTQAPRWTISLLFVVNTVMVVLLQVRASRGTENTARAARAHVHAAVLIAAACVLIALAGGRSPWVAVAFLLGAALVHVIGEVLQAAGSWGLAFSLAPANAQGQYQGAFAMGHGMAQAVAPLVLTTLTIEWGTPGWLVLGVAFVLVGAAVPRVARWAEHNRPHDRAPESDRVLEAVH